MWHEARKQEKKIRGMLVDYRKRAERRQDFYERIKADPTQFLQVHGRKCKIHLDASVATAAENPAIMMPWQGQKDNLIDRFDVRAHLDYIAPVPRTNPDQVDPPNEDDAEERAMNYERYRVLAQNEFLGIVEEKYLHQLHLEEQFGVNAQLEAEAKAAAVAAKKKSAAGAAIGYTYEETETVPGGSVSTAGGASVPFVQSITAIEKSSETSAAVQSSSGGSGAARFDECMKDESDSDLDMDVSIDINKIGTNQAHELNACGRQYGMKINDFYSFLTKDADEADALRMAREEEQEKIMFSGRKSRRERRAQRERKGAGRPLSPPSYAAKEELVPRTFIETNDSSRSPSPVNSGKITYITSFGGEEELQPHGKISFAINRDMSTLGGIAGTSKAARLRAGIAGSGIDASGTMSYADKVKQNLEKLKVEQSKESDRKPPVQYQRVASRGGRGRSSRSSSTSSSRSRSRSRRRRRSSSSRSRSRSRSRSKGRRRPRGATGGRSRSRSRSGGGRIGRSTYSRRRRRSKSNYRSRSRSRSRSGSRSRSRSRSHTRSKTSHRSPRGRYASGQTSGRRKHSPARSSSSSSTSSRSRSRSRTPGHRSPLSRLKRAVIPKTSSRDSDSDTSHASKKGRPLAATVTTQEKVPPTVPHAIIGVLPPPPPPPLPIGVSIGGSAASTEEKKPIPSLALIEPEPEVPIKRYYGRRRGDESSSDEASTSGDDTNGVDRKPPPGLLTATDPPCEDETAGITSAAGSNVKSSGGGFDLGMVQIKQEKLDPSERGDTPSSGAPSTGGVSDASLRFGKTVTGGTSAPESKIGVAASSVGSSGGTSSKSINPRDRLKRKMQILLNKQYKADKKAENEKVERQIQQQQERDDEMRELALKLRRRQRELRHKYGTPESEHSKSHSSEEHSSDEGQPPPGDDAATSPQRSSQQLIAPLVAVPPPKMALHSRPTPPSLHANEMASSGGQGYGNSIVIERKPILRSASNSGALSHPPPAQGPFGGGDIRRLRRQNSPPPSGGVPSRGYGGAGGGMPPSMNLRRGGRGMTSPGRGTGQSFGRFDDYNRRRSPPARYDRPRSKSRERMPSRDTGPGTGGYGRGGGRRADYGRSRDYDRYHGYAGGSGSGTGGGGGGGGGGSGYHSGFSGGSRYRGRRSRSGSRGRRSRSTGRQGGSPTRPSRGNGGSGGSGNVPSSGRTQSDRSPKPLKKLVDY
ncbi:CLK4-associating serine/arginine rich protein [Anopheles nili]|uniref:CLK4-associating serine/arginine rich protein n=1 Tax=Anopheles nili TaxID=185578 RepID=UPI00237B1B5A|nr:CLK4-associating serine/arginine rich protein [Anopheles nili]